MTNSTPKRISHLFIRPIRCYTTTPLPDTTPANLSTFIAHYRPAWAWLGSALLGMVAWVSLFVQGYTFLNVLGTGLTVPMGLYLAFVAVGRGYVIVSNDSFLGVILGILLVGLFASMIWPPVQFVRQSYFLIQRWSEWRRGLQYVMAHTFQPVRMA